MSVCACVRPMPYMSACVSHVRKGKVCTHVPCCQFVFVVKDGRDCRLMNRQVRHNKSTAATSDHSDTVSHEFQCQPDQE